MPKRVELKEVFPAEASESVDIRDQEPEAEPPVKLGELDGRAKPFRSSGGTATMRVLRNVFLRHRYIRAQAKGYC